MTETANHHVPPMTDPRGAYWPQPARERILVDDHHAVMTRYDFEQLPEYSASIPTGTYPGKMWKCGMRGGSIWYLRWYGEPGPTPGRPSETSIPIESRLVLLV